MKKEVKREFNLENTVNLHLTILDQPFGFSGETIKGPAFEVEFMVNGVVCLEVINLQTLKEIFNFDITSKDVEILLAFDRGLKILLSKTKSKRPHPDYTLVLSNGRRVLAQGMKPQDAIETFVDMAKEELGLARFPDSNT